MADYKKTKEDKKREAASAKRMESQRNKLDYNSYPFKNKQVDRVKVLMDKQQGLNATGKTSYS